MWVETQHGNGGFCPMAKSMRRLSSKTFFFLNPFFGYLSGHLWIVAAGWWPNLPDDHSPWAWGHWCQKGFKYSVWPACGKPTSFIAALWMGAVTRPSIRPFSNQVPLFQSPFWHSGLLLRPCPGLCLHCLPNNWVHWFFLRRPVCLTDGEIDICCLSQCFVVRHHLDEP